MYFYTDVYLRLSQVCLEEPPFQSLMIWNSIIDKMKQYLDPSSSAEGFQCDNLQFEKLKYDKH
jgi:hypothetical protein